MTASTALTGFIPLLRLALRRDLMRTIVWAVVLCGLLAACHLSFLDMYPDQNALDIYASAMGAMATMRMFNGPATALDTRGGQLVFELGTYLLLVVGVISILTVIRHGRREEETGGVELARTGVVGRLAVPAAAVGTAHATAAVWAVLVAGTLIVIGLPTDGALAYAAGLFLVASVCSALAALTSAVSRHARTAATMAGVILAAGYLARGLGDVRGDGLVWASPLGWVHAMRPFGEVRWWPLLIAFAVAAILVAGAARVDIRRDLGAGLWSVRGGPAAAGRWQRSLGGLVARQHAGLLVGWAACLAALGGVVGWLVDDVTAEIDPRTMTALLGAGDNPAESFSAYVTLLLAVLAACAGVAALTVARTEELSGRLGVVFSGAVSRRRWLGWQVGCAMAGASLALIAGGVGLAMGRMAAVPDTAGGDVLTGALAYLPAVWVVTAVAALATAAWPRRATLVWAPVAAATTISLFGGLLQLSQPVLNLSPFSHIPMVPPDTLADPALGVLTGTAAVGVVVGLIALHSRDVS